jgi:YjzC-like protein
MVTQVGSTYKTGEKAPVSGVYRFVRHTDGTTHATPAEQRIPLSKGETFPPCRSGDGKGAIWTLERLA